MDSLRCDVEIFLLLLFSLLLSRVWCRGGIDSKYFTFYFFTYTDTLAERERGERGKGEVIINNFFRTFGVGRVLVKP